jgi:plasmid stabilization system protein ParE
MSRRYVLAPEAAHDLVQIWRYIKKNASIEMADRVESVIREKIVYLAGRPGGGHWRKDLTDEPVNFSDLLLPDRLPTRDEPLAGCRHSPWPPRRGGASQGSLINRTRFLFARSRACASQKSVARLLACPDFHKSRLSEIMGVITSSPKRSIGSIRDWLLNGSRGRVYRRSYKENSSPFGLISAPARPFLAPVINLCAFYQVMSD